MITKLLLAAVAACTLTQVAHAQLGIDPANKFSWQENCGWMNWSSAAEPVQIGGSFLAGRIWTENVGWVSVGHTPPNGVHYPNTDNTNYGVNIAASGTLSGLAWGENVGWINFGPFAFATPPNPASLDFAAHRFRGWAWGENIGWINLDDINHHVGVTPACGSSDFDCDGSPGTDADIEAFFRCLAGSCPPAPCTSNADFNADGDLGTDADIEAFFRVLGGGNC